MSLEPGENTFQQSLYIVNFFRDYHATPNFPPIYLNVWITTYLILLIWEQLNEAFPHQPITFYVFGATVWYLIFPRKYVFTAWDLSPRFFFRF